MEISKNISSKINPLWALVGSTGYIGVKCLFNSHNIAYCEQNEIIGASKDTFDWKKLLTYISPDILSLLSAIVVRKFKV